MPNKQEQVRNVVYGSVEGTGADLIVPLPGRPLSVQVTNIDSVNMSTMFHYRGMAADSGVKISSKTPVGTNANESAHTHAVALDSGSSGAEAAHTHAVALDSGTSAAGSSHSHGMTGSSVDSESAHTHAVALDSGTSAAGSSHQHAVTGLSNAASVVDPEWFGDLDCSTKPTIALTHNADPQTNLNAEGLYATEAQGNATKNVVALESTTDSNANVLGETANGVGGGVAASCRFFVKDNNSPAGVQIYVNESSSDQLEFISPTTTDAYIIMPYEIVAGGIPGYACAVKIHHNAAANSGKALYFDDNGGADAQLCFVDTGAAGGTIPAADVTVIGPGWLDGTDGCVGSAEAQVISGNVDAEAAHTHGPGSLADAASAAGSAHNHGLTTATTDAEAAHTHGPGSLADAASAAGSSHIHGAGSLADAASGAGSAHTHTFTGTADSVVDYISSDGITLDHDAFKLGADSDINVSAKTIQYVVICG